MRNLTPTLPPRDHRMLLTARAAARCGSCGIPKPQSRRRFGSCPLPELRRHEHRQRLQFRDSVSWARPAPSVRRQHRDTEEDRQHQEREAGCRPLPEHAIDAFDRFAQSEGRASGRPDHRDEDLSHRDALAILLGRWGARPRDARFKACPAACSKDGEQFQRPCPSSHV